MWRSLDTSIDARERQLERLRAMTPAARIELADAISDEVRSIAKAGIRARHPDWTPADVDAELRRLVELARSR